MVDVHSIEKVYTISEYLARENASEVRREFHNGNVCRDAIVNPLLIGEVLFEDTRPYDKSEKFENYCTIPGFREYILIEPHAATFTISF